MNRTSASMSLIFAVAFASAAGCSSKTDSNTKDGTGGTGASAAGTSSGGSSAGTTATSGGTSSSSGGTNSNAGGMKPSGGSGGSGGSAAGLCADEGITCVDATTATGCNPDTGKIETFSCVDDAKTIGLVSSGCMKDPMGDHCIIDSLSDQGCADGANAFGYCENATTDEELFNVYVNCYLDNMGAHEIVTCFSKYVTPTMKTAADCNTAETTCLGNVNGAGGAQGAGGAP